MNPYYYLFYKLNLFLNKKGDNQWGPIGGVTLFIECNIIVPYVKFLHIDEANVNGIYKIILIIFFVAIFITNAVIFSNKRRVSNILDRYKNESDMSRIMGNSLVVLYVALSLGIIVFL